MEKLYSQQQYITDIEQFDSIEQLYTHENNNFNIKKVTKNHKVYILVEQQNIDKQLFLKYYLKNILKYTCDKSGNDKTLQLKRFTVSEDQENNLVQTQFLFKSFGKSMKHYFKEIEQFKTEKILNFQNGYKFFKQLTKVLKWQHKSDPETFNLIDELLFIEIQPHNIKDTHDKIIIKILPIFVHFNFTEKQFLQSKRGSCLCPQFLAKNILNLESTQENQITDLSKSKSFYSALATVRVMFGKIFIEPQQRFDELQKVNPFKSMFGLYDDKLKKFIKINYDSVDDLELKKELSGFNYVIQSCLSFNPEVRFTLVDALENLKIEVQENSSRNSSQKNENFNFKSRNLSEDQILERKGTKNSLQRDSDADSFSNRNNTKFGQMDFFRVTNMVQEIQEQDQNQRENQNIEVYQGENQDDILNNQFYIEKKLQDTKSSGTNAIEVLDQGVIAEGGDDCEIKIWDLYDQSIPKILIGHSQPIYCLKLIIKNTLASGSNTVKVWDISTGMCLKTLRGGEFRISEIVKVNEDTLAVSSHDCLIRIWHWKKNQCIGILKGHQMPVISLTLLDEKRLISGSDDCCLRIWDWQSKQTIAIDLFHASYISKIVKISDNLIATGSGDGMIKFIDTKENIVTKEFDDHDSSICSLLYENQHKKLFSGSSDSTIIIYGINKMEKLQVMEDIGTMVLAIAQIQFTDQNYFSLIVGGGENNLYIISRQKIESVEELSTLKQQSSDQKILGRSKIRQDQSLIQSVQRPTIQQKQGEQNIVYKSPIKQTQLDEYDDNVPSSLDQNDTENNLQSELSLNKIKQQQQKSKNKIKNDEDSIILQQSSQQK